MAYDILGNNSDDDTQDDSQDNSYQQQQDQDNTEVALQQNAANAAPPNAGPVPGGNPPLVGTPDQAAAPADSGTWVAPPNAPVVPSGQSNPVPWAPVAPQQQQPQPQQPQQPQPVNPAAQPRAPLATPTAVQPNPSLAAYTAQNESGNNPNIGYHNPALGTAYGTYGLTAAAYKDVQAANPAFAGVPITSLTPDQQTQANATYDQVLSKQLTALNVQPTDANLRLAHFLGAQGAANYLNTGAVSPAAAAANGGEAQVRTIAEGRLQGSPAPASGAANLQQPQTAADWAQQFQTASQNPQMTTALRTNPNAPDWIKQAAADTDYENLSNQKNAQQAQQQLQQAAQSGNWSALSQQLKSNSDSGSIFRAMFYKQAGLNDLATAEQQKLGAGRTWQSVTMPDGTTGVMQVGADGAPVKGYTEQGPMTDDQMGQAMVSNGGLGLGPNSKQATTTAQIYQDADGNAWTMTTVPGRVGAVWKNANTGAVSMLAPIGLHPLSQLTYVQKSNGALLTKMLKANADAASVGAPPLYSQDQITAARNAASNPLVAAQATQAAQGTPPIPPQGQQQPQPQVQYQSGNGALPGQNMQPQLPPVVPGQPLPQQQNGQSPANSPQPQAPINGGQPAASAPPNAPVAPTDNSPAAKIARYEMPMPSASRNSPADIAIRNQVYALNPNYDGTKYASNQKMIQDYTSGKSAQTLTNINTAVGHLEQFRNIAAQVGGTDTSSWNTFYQNMSKYGNAPEVKSKQAMAQFVAGEMVKAATGSTGGSVGEREQLEKNLMAANTPAEWTKVIDTQEALAHTRYDSMRSKYQSATGRNDFDRVAGLTPETKAVFNRIENPAGANGAGNSSNPFAAELARRQAQGQQ